MLMLAASSCGGAPPAPVDPSEGVVTGRDDPGRSSEGSPGGDSRSLEAVGTFGALVGRVRELDQSEGEGSTEGCLLGGTGSGERPYRLGADLSVAVRPLPVAPRRIGSRFSTAAASPRVLSVWGSRGDGGLGLVVFTSTPPLPEAELMVIALTERGLFLTHTGSPPAPSPPFPLAELPARLAALAEPAAVIVTADGATPLASLRALLGSLSSLESPVALAVALPEGTRLPAPRRSGSEEETGFCPEGLDPPPEDATEGTLDSAEIRAALAPFARDAPSCFAAARHGAVSGRYELTFRIESDGHVSSACAMADTARDAALRDCLLRRLGSIRFPRPQPAGFVDISLPVELAAAPIETQRPLCD